ncbi:hypothetical protein NVV76_09260, partial [Pediococcus ethanolidurans]|uniref:hypothetical protein n=1 Tax=Pediococcus ethanolidurans TaxID=319653 RepID=UPI0021E801E0
QLRKDGLRHNLYVTILKMVYVTILLWTSYQMDLFKQLPVDETTSHEKVWVTRHLWKHSSVRLQMNS